MSAPSEPAVAPVTLVEPAPLVLRRRVFDAARPAVMGIVNRTPDSFYASARFGDLAGAAAHLDRLVAEGADIIDIGGVRAGQEGDWIDAAEEIARVEPFLAHARAAYPDLILSLDTWRSEVARACGPYVDLVNDTWQGADPALVTVAAELGAGYVVSHTGGAAPRTDPRGVTYDDVVADVLRVLAAGAARAVEAGVAPEAVLIDPTLDFGKTTRHSLRVLRSTAQVASLGFPVLQALSRKDFVGETLDIAAPSDRLLGTLAATSVSAWLGAQVYRAHDVAATRQTLDMVASIAGHRPPAVARRGLA